jgi:hypothetical protein
MESKSYKVHLILPNKMVMLSNLIALAWIKLKQCVLKLVYLIPIGNLLLNIQFTVTIGPQCQLFTATTALFDEKLFPKCKTSAPKPITQVKEPVSIDKPKPRTVSWDDDDDDFYQIARRPPFHFIPPPVPGAGPPAPSAPPAHPPPPAMPPWALQTLKKKGKQCAHEGESSDSPLTPPQIQAALLG